MTSPKATIHVQVTWNVGTPRPDRHVVRDRTGAVLAEVAGNATSALVTAGITCGVRQAFTVEAVTDDGGSASAQSAVMDADDLACFQGPQQPPAVPVNVTATAHPDGSVTVSWALSTGGAVDSYLVGPLGGSTTTAPAGATSVVLRSLQPADGVQFVVQAIQGARTSTSQPSAPITIAGPPGAVTGLDVSMGSHPGGGWNVNATWSAADDHGSAVTGYVVDWSALGVRGSSTATSTSTAFSLTCTDLPDISLCTDGGTLTLTVTPRNSLGDGPAASASETVGPLIWREAVPRDRDVVVASIEAETPGVSEPAVRMTAHLDPPAAWVAHTGGCTLVVTPPSGPNTTRSIGCGPASYNVGTYLETGSVTVRVYANDVNGVDVSAMPVLETVPPRSTWPFCDATSGECLPVGCAATARDPAGRGRGRRRRRADPVVAAAPAR